ncbi:hypothetical protein ACWEJ6_53375 [Nonomuraea sp. NPDC004702]
MIAGNLHLTFDEAALPRLLECYIAAATNICVLLEPDGRGEAVPVGAGLFHQGRRR